MADGDVSLRFRLLGEDASASRAFNKVGQASDHLNTKMVAVGAAIGSLAAGGLVALGGLAAGAIKTGVTTAAAMEQASIGFTTLLGSAQKAKSFVADLSAFAANTPFEFSGLVDSSRLLLGVGVAAKQVVPMLTDFGDAAGALSIQQDAFQRIMLATSQAISAGKFQAGDLNQIMTNGLPVWTLLSKAMHKSVPELRDLASHGKLLAKDVLPVLQQQMHKDYGGAMAAQSKTLTGLWSTLMDTFSQGMASVLLPLMPTLKDLATKGIGLLAEGFKNLPGKISEAMKRLGEIKDKIAPIASEIASTVKEKFSTIADKIRDVAKEWGGKILEGIKTGMATGDWGSLGVALGQGLTAAITSLAQGGAAITGALATLFLAIDWLELGKSVGRTAVPFGIGFVNALLDGVLDAVTNHPMDVLLFVAAFIPLGKLASAFGPVRTLLTKLPFGEWIVKALEATAGKAYDAIAAFVGFVFRAFRDGFASWFPGVSKSFSTFFRNLGEDIGIIAKWAAEKARDFVYGIAHAIGNAAGGVVRAILDLIADMIRPFARAGSWLISKGADAVMGLGRGIASEVRYVDVVIMAAIRRIIAPFATAGRWLLDAGGNVMSGLLHGIERGAQAVWDKIASIANGIKDKFASVLHIFSPSRVMMKLGQNVIEGVEEGLKSRAPAVFTLLEQFAQRIGNIKVTAGVKNHLEKLAVGVEADMRAATARLDKVKAAVEDQRKKVVDLIKAKADYAATLTSGLTGGGTIAGIQLAQDTTDAEGNVVQADKVGSFIAALQAKADAITRFGTDIAALRAKGLSQSILQQIEQSGLETGGALAAALSTATPAAIRQIDALGKYVQERSDLFGKRWAGEMYDSGIKAAEGIVKGLQSKQSEILAQIRALAQSIVNEIKRTLKIKSPSGVMRDEVGAMIPAGIIAGIGAGAPGVASAMGNLVRVPRVGVGLGGGAVTSGVGGGGGVTNVHLHLGSGFVGSPQQIATAMSDVMQRAKSQGLNLTFA